MKNNKRYFCISYFENMDKNEIISLLKECGAIKYGKFILTSGETSDYYIDIKKASTNPLILKKIIQEISKYSKNYDYIAGMELGAVPLIVALSLETNIPYIIIRKNKRDHGTSKQIEGDTVNNKKVLIIEDVTTSGGSVIESIRILKRNNAILDKVIVVVDRENGAKEKVRDLNLELISLLSKSEILNRNCLKH
jgi:orotate phosphoribosyltransferase